MDEEKEMVLEAYIAMFTPEILYEYEVDEKHYMVCEFAGTDFHYQFIRGTFEYGYLKTIYDYLRERGKRNEQ